MNALDDAFDGAGDGIDDYLGDEYEVDHSQDNTGGYDEGDDSEWAEQEFGAYEDDAAAFESQQLALDDDY